MGSDKGALLAIFWFFLMTLGHPLLGISAKLSLFTLDISKAIDRVWHKALISKLPSFGFYLSLCSFFLISNFLSDRYSVPVVDGHCSSSKPINCGVPQGSVLSSTLFLLFINDSILHFSTSFSRRLN